MSAAPPPTDELARRSPGLVRSLLLLVWISVKLVLITAMLNRDIASFVYEGF